MGDVTRLRPRAGRRPPATVPASLIDDARRADEAAFAALFRTYQPGLLRYLRSVAPDLAPDVAAATWESVAGSIAGFRGDGDDFRRWLFTIARRRLVDEVRRDVRRPLQAVEVPDRGDCRPEPGERLAEVERAASLLSALPTRQAEVVALRVLGGLGVSEVADLLGITEGNVRVLSHRGLQALSSLLAGDDGGRRSRILDEA